MLDDLFEDVKKRFPLIIATVLLAIAWYEKVSEAKKSKGVVKDSEVKK